VILTLKAHSVPGALSGIQPLLGPETAVVWAVNGVPWWYFYRLKGPWENHRLISLDPDGAQWEGIGPNRIIGCVVYPAAEVVQPGVVRHVEGNRFTLGEPDNTKTERVQRLAKALIAAGMRAPIRNIRDEIWVKLWGNLCFNPISALTLATLDTVAEDPGTKKVARAMMTEAQAIGEALGVRFSVGLEQRIAGAAAVGPHRTSMLQDLERGRPMEIDALVTAVREMGDLAGVPTPTIDTVLALIQQRAREAGSYE
jgi:2-dehydropantoate 2-reductase